MQKVFLVVILFTSFCNFSGAQVKLRTKVKSSDEWKLREILGEDLKFLQDIGYWDAALFPQKIEIIDKLVEKYPNWDEAVFGSIFIKTHRYDWQYSQKQWEQNKLKIHQDLENYINSNVKIITLKNSSQLDFIIARYLCDIGNIDESYSLGTKSMNKLTSDKVRPKSIGVNFHDDIITNYLKKYPNSYVDIGEDNKILFPVYGSFEKYAKLIENKWRELDNYISILTKQLQANVNQNGRDYDMFKKVLNQIENDPKVREFLNVNEIHRALSDNKKYSGTTTPSVKIYFAVPDDGILEGNGSFEKKGNNEREIEKAINTISYEIRINIYHTFEVVFKYKPSKCEYIMNLDSYSEAGIIGKGFLGLNPSTYSTTILPLLYRCECKDYSTLVKIVKEYVGHDFFKMLFGRYSTNSKLIDSKNIEDVMRLLNNPSSLAKLLMTTQYSEESVFFKRKINQSKYDNFKKSAEFELIGGWEDYWFGGSIYGYKRKIKAYCFGKSYTDKRPHYETGYIYHDPIRNPAYRVPYELFYFGTQWGSLDEVTEGAKECLCSQAWYRYSSE